MHVSLPLDEMTIEDKIKVIETLWNDLCQNESDLPSPFYHEDVLKERERKVKEDKEQFTDWEEAKNHIKESLQ